MKRTGRLTTLDLTPAQSQNAKSRILGNTLIMPSGCWIWQGPPNMGGYGQFGVSNLKTNAAHVWAYAAWIGPIPAGFEIGHTCDVRLCCNPSHLNLVTHMGNMRHAVLRGRMPGNRCGQNSEMLMARALVAITASSDGLTVADLEPMLGGDYQRASRIRTMLREAKLITVEWMKVPGQSKPVHLMRAIEAPR